MSKYKALPSLERLHELLILDPSSPSGLRWKVRRSRRVLEGSNAGCKNSLTNYWLVTIDKESFVAHRVVYFMHHGVDPREDQIDHKDGDRSNNSIENLRLVDDSTNKRNVRVRKHNILGHRGISKVKAGPGAKSFRCRFLSPAGQLDKKFRTLEEAIKQRRAWEEEYFPGVYLREDGL